MTNKMNGPMKERSARTPSSHPHPGQDLGFRGNRQLEIDLQVAGQRVRRESRPARRKQPVSSSFCPGTSSYLSSPVFRPSFSVSFDYPSSSRDHARFYPFCAHRSPGECPLAHHFAVFAVLVLVGLAFRPVCRSCSCRYLGSSLSSPVWPKMFKWVLRSLKHDKQEAGEKGKKEAISGKSVTGEVVRAYGMSRSASHF